MDDALCNLVELKGWLWPVEGIQDGEMLGGFLKAIVKGNVSGFLRFVAVHQTAACLWPDMMELGNGKKMRENVLRAFLASADEQTLQEILCYHQQHATLVPPVCYQARLEWIRNTVGEEALHIPIILHKPQRRISSLY